MKYKKHFFQTHLEEYRGVAILLVIIVLTTLVNVLYPILSTSDKVEIVSFDPVIEDSLNSKVNSDDTIKLIQISNFDPNTITKKSLQQMGLSKKTSENWVSYRKAIGGFKKIEQIKKVYGLEENVFRQMRNHILLDSVTINDIETSKEVRSSNHFGKLLGLNSADQLDLCGLKGVGKVLASRIIKYRELLGGYVELNQLIEVYGISKENYDKLISQNRIYIDTMLVEKININQSSFKQILKHPYINYEVTKKMFRAKDSLGSYKSLGEIKKHVFQNDSLYLKIAPYIKI